MEASDSSSGGGSSDESDTSTRSGHVVATDTGDAWIQSRISAGQRSLFCMRCCVGGSLMLLSLAFYVGYYMLSGVRQLEYGQSACICSWQVHIRVLLAEVCFHGRLITLSFAPLADDIWFTRFVLLIDAIFVHINTIRDVHSLDRLHEVVLVESHAYPLKPIIFALFISVDVVSIVFTAVALCIRNVATMQARMWDIIATFFLMHLPIKVITASTYTFGCGNISTKWWTVILHFASVVLICNSRFRGRMQDSFVHMTQMYFDTKEAACIAGLVGNCSSKGALSQASRRFRCIQLTDIAFEEMLDNRPNRELYQRSSPISLQECDAFISHSWSDDAETKWATLQEWRSRFLAQEGREPTLWIDKCCIDQRNIEEDLRCLPIFLSGCRKLVVLQGESYLSRLWCIMELFTFVHMGRCVNQIELLSVCRFETEVSLIDTVESFDATKCTCFNPEDKTRMLPIIRASCGSMEVFNDRIKEVVRCALLGITVAENSSRVTNNRTIGTDGGIRGLFSRGERKLSRKGTRSDLAPDNEYGPNE